MLLEDVTLLLVLTQPAVLVFIRSPRHLEQLSPGKAEPGRLEQMMSKGLDLERSALTEPPADNCAASGRPFEAPLPNIFPNAPGQALFSSRQLGLKEGHFPPFQCPEYHHTRCPALSTAHYVVFATQPRQDP